MEASQKYLVAAVIVIALWMTLVALAVVIVRMSGWARIKQDRWSLLILAFVLIGLPATAAGAMVWSYRGLILFRTESFWTHSPMIILPQSCTVLPSNNIWNTRVDALPRAARSDAYITSIGRDVGLHGDFGRRDGIPYMVVDSSAPMNDVIFQEGGESDPPPYRIPSNAPIENGGDGHVVVLDKDACRLYELFLAHWVGTRWEAASGAIFDLRSNALRPLNWTSTDAAGLPVLPGLIRYQEVVDGEIRHCLRFTARHTQRAFVWPARHRSSALTDENVPPMGQRFRLRQNVDISGFSPETQVILNALKIYGVMLADNGGNWFLTGAPDSRWNKRLLVELNRVKGSDMEAVDVSSLMVDKDSGEARF